MGRCFFRVFLRLLDDACGITSDITGDFYWAKQSLLRRALNQEIAKPSKNRAIAHTYQIKGEI